MPSPKEIKVLDRCDVLVIGGGTAGIAAAAASARAGAKTLLVEKYGFLGGIATGGIVGSFCGFFTSGDEKKAIVGGVADKIIAKLEPYSGISEKRVSKVNPRLAVYQYNPGVLKFVADELVTQSGAKIHFHTLVCEVLTGENGQVEGVVVENKSGRFILAAKIVIDATGDGDIAALAGIPFELGDGKGSGQAMTTMFRLANVDPEAIRALDRAALRERLIKAVQDKEFKFYRVDPVIGPALPVGVLQVNMTGISGLDGTNADHLSAAEIEGRRQVFEYLKFFRKYQPGFEKAEICQIGTQVGIRETRRVLGEYLLNEEEVLKGKKFDDGIALGAWPVEFHDPGSGKIVWKYLDENDDYYSIPLGCMIARGAPNLLTAGRCISCTHIAQGTTRVIGQALGTGEAAGTLAAMAVDTGQNVRAVDPKRVRKSLLDHGATLQA